MCTKWSQSYSKTNVPHGMQKVVHFPLWGWFSLQAGRCRWFGAHCHHCECCHCHCHHCEWPHYLWRISSQCKLIKSADQGQNILSQEYCLQPCAGLVRSFLFQQVGVPAGLVIGNFRLDNKKYYDIIFFHKNIVSSLLQVWSALVIGDSRLNRRKEIAISFPFATCSLSNWCRG